MLLPDLHQSFMQSPRLVAAVRHSVNVTEEPGSHARGIGFGRQTKDVYTRAIEIACNADARVVKVHHENRRPG
jgi:hypothetical protein